MVRPAAAALALVVLGLSTLPVPAQWLAVGRWGSEGNFRYVRPGTWMVEQQAGGVSISAEGDHHEARIELSCDAGSPARRLRLSGYRGDALDESALAQQEPRQQALSLVLDGRAFELMVDYRPATHDWLAVEAPGPEFLDALAMGSRLEILNTQGVRVAAVGLSGSGAAREAVRRACGI
ncbi:hypothetical protein [Pararhodobacter aggregans]|uniref:hypothetical protein n=1 Tax=Pararhodobacter aggregans TaxID=404875 RepID=UPI003A8DF7CE